MQTFFASFTTGMNLELKCINATLDTIGICRMYVDTTSLFNLISRRFVNKFVDVLPFVKTTQYEKVILGVGGKSTLTSYITLHILVGRCTIIEADFWIIEQEGLPDLILGARSLEKEFSVWGFDERHHKMFFWAHNGKLETLPCGWIHTTSGDELVDKNANDNRNDEVDPEMAAIEELASEGWDVESKDGNTSPETIVIDDEDDATSECWD